MKIIFRHIRRVLAVVILASAIGSAYGVTMPVRTINGRDYYYREVQPKETIYGLCRELGISKADLIRFNPTAADGLRSGMTLYFPVDEMTSVSAAAPVIAGTQAVATPQVKTAAARVHHVAKGETLYGISKHYGISIDRIIELNPQAADGLKTGTLLDLGSESDADTAEAAPIDKNMTPRVPVLVGNTQPEPMDAGENATPVDTVGEEDDEAPVFTTAVDNEDDTIRVAVVLPFMLSAPEPDKQAQLYTEFFKGMLLAADSLKSSARPIVISAYDSANSLDSVRALTTGGELTGTDVIITPDNEDQLNVLIDYATANGGTVLNIFAVKDTRYLSTPDVLQANIPHSDMYSNAVKGLLDHLEDRMPVILNNPVGRHDKQEFVNELKIELGHRGIEFKEIDYETYMQRDDFLQLGNEDRWIFIPSSGSQAEFNHVAGALRSFRESLDDPTRVTIFGYPEWITFRGDALENMRALEATIYSRFYNDPTDIRSRELADKFKRFYGSDMMGAVPVQGILGFDTGYYLISALNEPGTLSDNMSTYNGIQSGFHFVKPDNGLGRINDMLYFIRFRPSGLVTKSVL